MYEEEMIDELAAGLRNAAAKAGGRGMRVSFEWLRDVLGDDQLSRRVLRAAGFTPPVATEWSTGRGDSKLADFTYPVALAERMEDILDDYA